MNNANKNKATAQRYKRAWSPSAMKLTDRDAQVLEALATHRILSTDQLKRLVFQCSESRVRRRLRRLYDHQLVDRVSVVSQPTKRIPPFVYLLGKRGIGALTEMGFSVPSLPGGSGSLEFVRHRLQVNEFCIALTEAVRGTGYRIVRWQHEQSLKLPTPDGKGRAEVVRHPSLAKPTSFLPDAFFELQTGPDRSMAYFVEVDMATHAQRIWQQRAKLYTVYSQPEPGLFSRRFGRHTFRLLVITTDDYRRRSRCDNILKTIHETVGPSDLFLATTFDQITADRLLTDIWKRPGRETRQSMLANPGAQGTQRTVVQSRRQPVRVTRVTVRQTNGST